MARKLLSVVGVGMLAFALTGCAAEEAIVRGQCPPGYGVKGRKVSRRAMRRAPRQMTMPQAWSCPTGCQPMACQTGQCGGRAAGCRSCLNLPFHPVHRNYYNYQVPRNLSYPQQNTPAAVVQYPYYTMRGPTDFFYDK